MVKIKVIDFLRSQSVLLRDLLDLKGLKSQLGISAVALIASYDLVGPKSNTFPQLSVSVPNEVCVATACKDQYLKLPPGAPRHIRRRCGSSRDHLL